jgi:hypothetical protein
MVQWIKSYLYNRRASDLEPSYKIPTATRYSPGWGPSSDTLSVYTRSSVRTAYRSPSCPPY